MIPHYKTNHAEGVHGIKAKPCMESATCCGMESSRRKYTLTRDAIHVFDVIPFRRFATDAIPSLPSRLG